MPNITETTVDTGNVILEGAVFRDDVINLSANQVLKAGTILARDTGTDKLVVYEKGGSTTGNGDPKVILTYTVTADGTGGDEVIRPAVSGKFRAERLVIDADGDNTNIDAPVLDALRDYGLVAVNVHEMNEV